MGERSIRQVQISLNAKSQPSTEPRVLRKVPVWWWVCKPILVFSLSLSQAGQQYIEQAEAEVVPSSSSVKVKFSKCS